MRFSETPNSKEGPEPAHNFAALLEDVSVFRRELARRCPVWGRMGVGTILGEVTIRGTLGAFLGLGVIR